MKRLILFFHPLITREFWKSFLFFLLITLLFTFAMISGGFESWFLFCALLPIFFFMLLLIVYPYQTIELNRRFAQVSVYGGEDLAVQLTLKKKWIVPLFAVLIEDIPASSSASGFIGQARSLSWMGRKSEFHYTLEHLSHGRYQFSTILLTTGDPFGFFRRQVRLKCLDTLIVYPRILPIQIPGRGQLDLRHPDKMEKDFSQFSGVRAFQPSDRLSWLDWKATARSGEMVTKEFDLERDREALITLISSPHAEKVNFERALSLTASLIAALTADQFALIVNETAARPPVKLLPRPQHALQTVYRRLALLDRDNVNQLIPDTPDSRVDTAHFLITTEIDSLQEFSKFSHRRKKQLLVFCVTEEHRKEWAEQAQKMGVRSFFVVKDDFRHLTEAGEKNG